MQFEKFARLTFSCIHWPLAEVYVTHGKELEEEIHSTIVGQSQIRYTTQIIFYTLHLLANL